MEKKLLLIIVSVFNVHSCVNALDGPLVALQLASKLNPQKDDSFRNQSITGQSSNIPFTALRLAAKLNFYDIQQGVTYRSAMFPTMTSFFSEVSKLKSHYFEFANIFNPSVFGVASKQDAWKEFKTMLHAFYKVVLNNSLVKKQYWLLNNLGQEGPPASFYDINTEPLFIPYAQKLDAQQGDKFIFRGDLHGDIFSLAEELAYLREKNILDDNFKIIEPRTWMVFLGDFGDSGAYGPEVIYILMRLKIENPEHVILVRGNHDDNYKNKKAWDQWTSDMLGEQGGQADLLGQMNNRFSHQADIENRPSFQLERFYDLLPVVLYLGCNHNYLQCCHGGIELGYFPAALLDSDKQYQMLGNICRADAIAKLKEPFQSEMEQFKNVTKFQKFEWNCFNPTEDESCPTCSFGLLWNDFNPDEFAQGIKKQHEWMRPLMFGKGMTQAVLESQSSSLNKIRGILRGHQHNSNVMFDNLKAHGGVFNMWNLPATTKIQKLDNGVVWTFNTAPDQPGGAPRNYYGFDTFGIVTVANSYSDWTMEIVNIQIIPGLETSPYGALPARVKVLAEAKGN